MYRFSNPHADAENHAADQEARDRAKDFALQAAEAGFWTRMLGYGPTTLQMAAEEFAEVLAADVMGPVDAAILILRLAREGNQAALYLVDRAATLAAQMEVRTA